ncbi:L-arabinose transport system permease protein AraQ [Poriferisphaera corsica]|uniref:L-arabinose transport system permease protein AraQ n=1 Tax=Poriferisphaera corsica TaxID=2528020 RepID=A0A517YT53_9BACT|nr:carbohydrate ABC transporter permease [Poriferisphaera corsica]QDU33410.1 L-arabinose transport system permease protein AraQ [Poriferisphaera corsica]
MKKQSKLTKIILYVLLFAGSALFMLPLIWMLATSLKPLDQAMTTPPSFVPFRSYITENNKKIEVKEGIEITAPSYLMTMKESGKWMIAGVSDKLLKLDADGQSGTYDGMPITVTMQADASAEAPSVLVNEVLPKVSENTGSGVSNVLKVGRRWIVPKSEITEETSPRWENYSDSILDMGKYESRSGKEKLYFTRYLWNTITLCFLTVIGTVISCSLVAYGFSRINWRGRNTMFIVVLSTMMIPFPVVMVPLYSLFKELGWIGTLQPLWVPTFFAGAFNVFLLRQFFMAIPKDLSEAARIDGCSEFRIYWQIILPLAKPALMVVGLFQFMATWNDFLGPLLFLTDQMDFTLALGLQFYQSKQGGTDWHFLMAASSMIVLPVIVLFFFTQKTFIEGISMSGLKG